ncbi:MAG: glycerol-3-phosphate 1-O-acyltransferase PlsY [Acidimicrobiia bacterium]|nr:glycerol-3-phosphate 1-O-acyltransferase PlsY [Acidimicrobiia bacterium]
MQHLLAIVAAYLLGSVNFGIIVSSMSGVDIRSVGSGNPGTSNVLRTLGRRRAAIVLLGDALKGAAAAAIGVLAVDADFGYVTLLAAVIGHSFPIWHSFRGGKSVATAIGGFVYLAPVVGVIAGVTWIVIVLVWKTASIASIVSMLIVVPGLALTGRSTENLLVATVIVVFVIARHAGNISRIASGSERTV